MLDNFTSGFSDTRISYFLRDFKYFSTLSEPGKIRFIERVKEFINTKDFQAGPGLEAITDEMQVLISACAVQLTFGLKKFDLLHYHTIRIFPRVFYSHIRETYLKGGTTPGGTIFLSWRDFKEGYEHPDDRYNLGLHEMGHALKLDVIKGYDFDERFASYLDSWEEIGRIEFEKIRQGFPSFLRNYAGTNMHEFFAVCIEHFFEVPVEFKKRLPDIYNHLCVLLNQDPTNVYDDYRLEEAFYQQVNENIKFIPVPKGIKRTYKYSAWHWSLTLLMAGPTLGFLIIAVLSRVTILESVTIAYMVLGAGVLGLLQWKYFKDRNALPLPLFVMYSFFGFGINLVAVILFLNYTVRIFPATTETYRISNYYVEYTGSSNAMVPDNFIVKLENGSYDEYPSIRKFDYYSNQKVKKAEEVRLTFTRGLFGIKIFTGYEFVSSSDRFVSSSRHASSRT